MRAIEAIVMVADAPVEPQLLAQLLEMSPSRVEECCAELAASYRDDDRGFELVRVAGGYRFQSHADLAAYVERYLLEGQTARLSAAALETLAIVAYKQPVSRAQMAAIRGVSVDGVIRTLQSRAVSWPKWAGTRDPVRPCCTEPPPCCWSAWASTGSRSCHRWPSSFPVRRSWTPSSTRVRSDQRAGVDASSDVESADDAGDEAGDFEPVAGEQVPGEAGAESMPSPPRTSA